ncbi:hypothetical protein ACRAWF_06545 [Streptomyces sp. L7]
MSSAPIEHADGLPQPLRNQAVLTIALGIIMAVCRQRQVANWCAGKCRRSRPTSTRARPSRSGSSTATSSAITISLLPLASLGEIDRLPPRLSGRGWCCSRWRPLSARLRIRTCSLC